MKAIVTFHDISDDNSVISFSHDRFVNFLDMLQARAIPVLCLDDLLDPQIKRGVTITFDDGMASAFKSAMKTLAERRLPAHLFLVTSAAGSTNDWTGQPAGAPRYEIMSWEDVRAAHDMGILIEAHTHNHPDLRKLNDAEVLAEFDTCNSEIAARTGRAPKYFAFPYGFRDRRVQALAARSYAAAVSTQMGYLVGAPAIDALPRIDSFYLRPDWVGLDLGHPATRSYLATRSALRTVRGWVWNSSHA